MTENSAYGNWAMGKMFGPESEQVAGEWRKLYNAESFSVIKSRRMRWAGHVACVGC